MMSQQRFNDDSCCRRRCSCGFAPTGAWAEATSRNSIDGRRRAGFLLLHPQYVATPWRLEFLARYKEGIAGPMKRIPDRYFLGIMAPAAGQNSNIGFFEENEDRIGVPNGAQAPANRPGNDRPEIRSHQLIR